MSSLTIAWITFACVFGGALLGMFLRNVVPEDHLNQDSRDALKLGAGLIATMAALVISLLISSAKGSFDKQNDQLKEAAANLILTDRILAQYGQETNDIRDLMRRSIINIVDLIWPEDHPRDSPSTKLAMVPERVETVENEIRALTPRDDVQRSLQARALQISADEAKIRWLLFGQLGQGSIHTPFLILLVAWLVVIFMTFGLLAPRNTTVILVMLLCALSVSGALFLILEMDQPFQGWLKISSAPLRYTIAHLGQ